MSKAKVAILVTLLLGAASPALAQPGRATTPSVRPPAPATAAPATAQATTAQATMQQFCRDLSQRNWRAALGNMLGLKETEVSKLLNAYADGAFEVKTADAMFAAGRCEVVGGQGAQVRLKVSGADAAAVMERVMSDEAVLRLRLRSIQGEEVSDEAVQRTVEQVLQRQYQAADLPRYAQTVNVTLERQGGRWILDEDSLEPLLDGLAGGFSRL